MTELERNMKQEKKQIQDISNFFIKLEKFGKENHMFNIPRETAEFLFKLLKKRNPKSILEIGTSDGYSTCWMGLACPKAKIKTIERDEEKIKLARNNFKEFNLRNIEIIKGEALDVLKRLNKKFDFVFIDATKKEYVKYLEMLQGKLNKDAIIVADNINSHKIKDYSLKAKEMFKSKTLNIGTGIEVSYV